MIRSVTRPFIPLAVFAVTISLAQANELKINEVSTFAGLTPAQLKPDTIMFTDHRQDELVDPATGLIRFEDWAKAHPLQKQLLSLYPSYTEPTVSATIEGGPKSYVQKISMYVAEARFILPKQPDDVNLVKYAAIPFLTKIDSKITHQPITAADVIPAKDPEHAYNQRPDRKWCTAEQAICIQSRYQLEGKLPTGIYLVNQLTEGKKHADYLDFQSELRVVPQNEIDQDKLKKLTGIDTPVIGVLEQNIFYVNQIMEFGKFMAIVQPHPTDKSQTIATAYMALGIKTKVLDRRKEFERVPVLRNLVPGQLLMGNSSFNTGTSLSAGLPSYTRNQIQAIATIMAHG
ncbi:MAG TPA: hypothetical protein VMH84_04675 [Xanthobacteraceae bacterium]|nr:hypothetical protein [Xanthobacteraceae bacterium]